MIIVIFDSVIISKTDNSANCHNGNAPTATTKMRQQPQWIWVNCHNKIGSTATIESENNKV